MCAALAGNKRLAKLQATSLHAPLTTRHTITHKFGNFLPSFNHWGAKAFACPVCSCSLTYPRRSPSKLMETGQNEISPDCRRPISGVSARATLLSGVRNRDATPWRERKTEHGHKGVPSGYQWAWPRTPWVLKNRPPAGQPWRTTGGKLPGFSFFPVLVKKSTEEADPGDFPALRRNFWALLAGTFDPFCCKFCRQAPSWPELSASFAGTFGLAGHFAGTSRCFAGTSRRFAGTFGPSSPELSVNLARSVGGLHLCRAASTCGGPMHVRIRPSALIPLIAPNNHCLPLNCPPSITTCSDEHSER